ncbi:SMC-Scp complex subunit ScpB [Phytohabitans sp. LJ34]|uniref:SMC-Scp complex subunit ScpB n=1 Tax=Phytohabitans sp. LJ34 TaxID=3452217 RepID=UPI003F8A314C
MDAEPDTAAESIVDAQPAPSAEPAADAEPPAETEPATALEPLADIEPAPQAEPTADAEPAADADPASHAELATDIEPTTLGAAPPEPQADPAIEPAPEEQSALALIDDAELKGALEAILLVVDEPVTEIVLAQILEQPTERIAATLVTVAEGYTAAGHGFDLRKVAGGWRLYTRPEYAPYVERFVLDGQSVRLTQAALETLAVVAYKQPVTRSRISAIRGVNCDGVIRTLVSRGLVEECGTEPESGAFLYRTTTLFLEKLGMNSVNDLPPLAPFLPDDVEEIADATQ